ncbi:MAG: hypothetical protein HYW51_03360 [Candidatus Doudnabacteria bacterium]|nr:hypothetical protein [Candidatus Doudnabacteria bacterium]
MSRFKKATPCNNGVVLAVDFDFPMFHQSHVYQNDPCVRLVSSAEITHKFELPPNCTTVIFWIRRQTEVEKTLNRKAKKLGVNLVYQTTTYNEALKSLEGFWSWNFQAAKRRPIHIRDNVDQEPLPPPKFSGHRLRAKSLEELVERHGLNLTVPINDEVTRLQTHATYDGPHLKDSEIRLLIRKRRREQNVISQRPPPHHGDAADNQPPDRRTPKPRQKKPPPHKNGRSLQT